MRFNLSSIVPLTIFSRYIEVLYTVYRGSMYLSSEIFVLYYVILGITFGSKLGGTSIELGIRSGKKGVCDGF